MKLKMFKTQFVVIACFLFPVYSSLAQAHERHPDASYANTHVTGVGTTSIVYHLDKPIAPKNLQACKEFISNYKHVTRFEITDTEIKMEFVDVTSNEQIYLFIQRLEMYYIYKPNK